MSEVGVTSWDVGEFVEAEGQGTTVFRVSKEERPRVRKESVLDARDDLFTNMGRLENFLLEERELLSVERRRSLAIVGALANSHRDMQTSLRDTQTSLLSTQTSLRDMQTSLLSTQTSLRDMQASLLSTQTSLLSMQPSLLSMQTSLRSIQNSGLEKQERIIQSTAKALAEQDVVELHESLDTSLRAYNDLVFDTERAPRTPGDTVMDRETKKKLKAGGLVYITHLLEVPRGKTLEPAVEEARQKALGILTSEECQLCQILNQKLKEGRSVQNAQQHPKLDTETALHRIEALDIGANNLQVLASFLATDPKRIRNKNENPEDPKRFLFAGPGEYTHVSARREGLAMLIAAKMKDERLKEKLEEDLRTFKNV